MLKTRRILVHIILVLISLLFLATGIMKLLGLAAEVDTFLRWGYPMWLLYATGLVNILAAIGLHVKKFSRIAATTLIFLLLAAITTILFHDEGFADALPAMVLLLFLSGYLFIG